MTDDLLGYSVHFIFGGIVSLMSWFFGGRDGFLMVLLTFMVIDQFSGLAAGWAEHKISSEAGFKGILIPGFIRDRFLNMKKLNKKKVSP